jgi:uncharacterized protein (TIGR02145 family)
MVPKGKPAIAAEKSKPAVNKSSSKKIASEITIGEVKIKKRIWAKENLRVTAFKNGDEILEAKTDKEWKEANKKKKPAFCYFRNDSSKDVLYNWWAIEDERGLAPDGWIIPNENDFYELVNDLGGDEKAFHSLKSKSSWEKGCEGNGKSKFDAVPTGCRDNDGTFAGDESAYFWSKSEGELVLTREFAAFDPPYRYSLDEENGLAVRCVRPD